MRSKIGLVSTLGFGTLIALYTIVGYMAIRQSRILQQSMMASNEDFLETDSLLREIPGDLHLGGVLARDYLLDPSHITAPMHRQQLLDLRAEERKRVDLLERKIEESERPLLSSLRREMESYWDSFGPIFTWTPREKAALGSLFLRQQVLPKADAALEITKEIRTWNAGHFARKNESLRATQRDLERFLWRMIAFALIFGIPVAAMTVYRVTTLEHRNEQEKFRAESAESELRRLSSKLVRAQEDERRVLSRELHDAVGQSLTALKMDLTAMESARTGDPARFAERTQRAKSLVEETLRQVRDMAMGLRPSMLDDLGLGPALEWQGREFSRRLGVPVEIRIEGTLEGLDDAHRTCIFRVVQEALNNCAKHAKPSLIRVWIHGESGMVHLTVEDDGAGFDRDALARSGLGLISIEERVRELDGSVTLMSQPERGTLLRVDLPVHHGIANA